MNRGYGQYRYLEYGVEADIRRLQNDLMTEIIAAERSIYGGNFPESLRGLIRDLHRFASEGFVPNVDAWLRGEIPAEAIPFDRMNDIIGGIFAEISLIPPELTREVTGHMLNVRTIVMSIYNQTRAGPTRGIVTEYLAVPRHEYGARAYGQATQNNRFRLDVLDDVFRNIEEAQRSARWIQGYFNDVYTATTDPNEKLFLADMINMFADLEGEIMNFGTFAAHQWGSGEASVKEFDFRRMDTIFNVIIRRSESSAGKIKEPYGRLAVDEQARAFYYVEEARKLMREAERREEGIRVR